MLPRFQTQLRDLSLMQSQWGQILDPIVDSEINQGQILSGLSLSSGSNVINHKLGRPLLGWFLVRVRASATFYDQQDSNSTPQLTLNLVSSASVVVDLYVF